MIKWYLLSIHFNPFLLTYVPIQPYNIKPLITPSNFRSAVLRQLARGHAPDRHAELLARLHRLLPHQPRVPRGHRQPARVRP